MAFMEVRPEDVGSKSIAVSWGGWWKRLVSVISFPFQDGRKNIGRGELEAEGALLGICPCCSEKHWTSRDAGQAAGLEVRMLLKESV